MTELVGPAEGETPLTWPELDLLWTEVVMGTPLSQTQIPYTEESRRLRRRLRKEWRRFRRLGYTAEHVKD